MSAQRKVLAPISPLVAQSDERQTAKASSHRQASSAAGHRRTSMKPPATKDRRTSMSTDRRISITEVMESERRVSITEAGFLAASEANSRRTSLSAYQKGAEPGNKLLTKERSGDGRSTPTPGSPVPVSRDELTELPKSRRQSMNRRTSRRTSIAAEGGPSLRCRHCKAEFPSAKLKFEHIGEEHPDKQRRICKNSGCDREFDTKFELNTHERDHEKLEHGMSSLRL